MCTGGQRAPRGLVPGAPVRVCRGALGGAAGRLRGRAPRPPPRAAGCAPYPSARRPWSLFFFYMFFSLFFFPFFIFSQKLSFFFSFKRS